MSSSAEQIHASETPNAHIERRPVFKLTHQEAARFDSASGLFGLSIGRPIHLLYASGVHGVRVSFGPVPVCLPHSKRLHQQSSIQRFFQPQQDYRPTSILHFGSQVESTPVGLPTTAF